MARKEATQMITVEAGSDLSAKQFYFMKVNSSGQLALVGDGADALGVLHNEPSEAGRPGTVCIGGMTPIVFGGTVTAGDRVASDSNGKCVTRGTGDNCLGWCIEGGASGETGTIVFQPSGPGSHPHY